MRTDPRIPMPWELVGTDPAEPVLLALSGGADSRYLLECLARGAERDGFALFLAHVHHGIRGETADRDCDFCVGLAREYGLPIEVFRADVPALAKVHGRGIEEEARAVRYAFFERLMRERRIPLLATAHQADDLLETILFRIARGTDVRGLDPIPPVRRFGEGWLVRPLLELTAAEIRERCRVQGLEYVTDETNKDVSYARNRIRREVIPVLGSLFPEPQKRAERLTRSVRRDGAYLNAETEQFLREHPGDEPDCSALGDCPEAIRVRVISRWLEKNGAVLSDALRRRMEELISGKNGKRVPLDAGRYIVRRNGRLAIVRQSGEPVSYRIPFAEGTTELPGGWTVFVQTEGGKTKIHILSTGRQMIFPVKADIITKQGLYWRPKREGDRIAVGGMHRQLRRVWREAGVPEEERATLPVLCDENGIVWAPFSEGCWNQEE